MTQIPITDAHAHFWDTARHRHAWLTDNESLNRDMLPDQLDAAAEPLTVERIVYIESGVAPAERFDEVDWVIELAEQDSGLAAIVAAVPVELGEICCRAYEALAEKALVRGIRRRLAGRAEDFCLEPRFIEGIEYLAEFDFSFDLCISQEQLSNTIDLVCQCPEINFVLDHVGSPDVAAGIIEPWESKLAELAELDNCWCKLSGLATLAASDWQAADVRPYVAHAIKCFGIDRVMFGSDWPVSSTAVDYQAWVQLILDCLGTADTSAQRRVFHENAARFYRLDE